MRVVLRVHLVAQAPQPKLQPALVNICNPDCNTTHTGSNAVPSGGTCYCGANYYGSPDDGNVGSNSNAALGGCSPCPTGTTSPGGDIDPLRGATVASCTVTPSPPPSPPTSPPPPALMSKGSVSTRHVLPLFTVFTVIWFTCAH